MEFKRIVCAVDLSEASLRVLAHAAGLAAWYDARMTVLHVVPAFEPVLVPPAQLAGTAQVLYPMRREDVLAAIERVVAASGAAAADVTPAVEDGDAATVLVDQAVAQSADLLVMGTHGRRGFDRLLLGSVAERVLRRAPCPVLTVPPHAPAIPPADVPYTTILCPIDFSPASLQAFGFALALARRAKGTLMVLHAVEFLAEESPPYDPYVELPAFQRRNIERARERLEGLVAAETTSGCTVEMHVPYSRAYPEVLRVADTRSADLIVMGAQGRGTVGQAIFGSTTARVLRGAQCPVLTVRG